jgi:WD repeat-containing protein 48
MFSGGLDRQILAWDINSPRPDSPLTKLAFPESPLQGGGGGVYSLATNSEGTLVAAGTPEKVVRIWDPRVGGSADGVDSISKLVGHSDNIRSICLSDDGRYVSAEMGT